jgi:hypothetical protein
MMLIDPPVSPFSTHEEIEKWLAQLRSMKQTPEVKYAIKQAQTWLKEKANA